MGDDPLLDELAQASVCSLITVGRVTGRPHTIEIWFAASGHTLYMLSGGRDRSDWVKNLRARPRVELRIGGAELVGDARLVTDAAEDRLARDLVYEKYQPGYGGDLGGWRERSLTVAVDLHAEPST